MSNYGLPRTTIQSIQALMKGYPAITKVLIYGSRAKGNYKEGSDIDLTMHGEQLNEKMRSEIAGKLADLPIPYSVDLSIYADIENTKLQDHIERVGKVFYEKSGTGWNMVKLKNVASFTRGLTYSKKDEVEISNTAVLRATNIDLNTHSLILNEIRYISDSFEVPTNKLVKKGDILICTASGSKKHLGKVALIQDDINMAFGGFMAAIRTGENCLSSYLFKVLTAFEFKNHLINLSDGASINNLKFSQVENFEIPLPPLPEQKRIVAKLGKAFAEIDSAIDATRRKHNEAEKLKQSLLYTYFSNDYEKLKGLGYEKVQLGDVASYDKQQGKGSNKLYVGMENITCRTMHIVGEINEISNTSSTFLFDNRHILFGRLRPYLQKILLPNFDGHCSTELFPILPTDKVIRKFLAYWLLSPKIANKIVDTSTGARMPRANMKAVLEFDFLLPPLPEQKRIVAKLDKAFQHIDIITANTQKQLSEYQALKSALLKDELQSEVP